MRSSSKELKELLPILPNQITLLSRIPIATSALIITFTTLSLLLSLFSSGFQKLEFLFQTKLMSTGIFLSSPGGFLTIFSFHFLLITKLKSSDSILYTGLSCISGTIGQISLLLLSFSIAEKNFVKSDFLEEEETLALAIFMISSVIFETLSLNLLLEFGGVLSKNEKTWVCLKIALVGVILFGSFLQGAMAILLQVIQEAWLRLAFDITQYSMFFLHAAYFSTFCYDLRDIQLTVDLKQEYEDSVNISTF
jgi:hypothetical protein